MKITETIINFKVDNKRVSITIIHNINNYDFNTALESWLARTKKYTDKSFVKYVKSKQIHDVIIMTKEQLFKYIKEDYESKITKKGKEKRQENI